MTESEFLENTEALFSDLQNALDANDAELDYEEQQGLLTIECADGSPVIVSRQLATREIWIAARSGGYHLSFGQADWICSKTGESILQLLSRVCSEQSGRTVEIEFK